MCIVNVRAKEMKTIQLNLLTVGAIFVSILFFSIPVNAEVMDKEPSILNMWLFAIPLGLLGLIIAAYRWWYGLISLLIAGYICYQPVSEWNDQFVGPAISREAGAIWGFSAYSSFVFVVVIHFAAWILIYLKMRRMKRIDEGKL